MKTFRDLLKDEFKDREFKKSFYKGLEKTRIAIEITAARERRRLSQKELADMVGSSQSAIARLENPDYNGYSIRTLRKIAEALDLQLTVSLEERAEQLVERGQGRVTKIYVVTNWPKKEKGYQYDFEMAELTEDQKTCVLS